MKKLFKFLLIIVAIVAIAVLAATAVAAAAGATTVGGGAAAGALAAGSGLGGAAATATSLLTSLGIATSASLSTVAIWAAGVLAVSLIVYDIAFRDAAAFKSVGNAIVKAAKRTARAVRKQTRAARSSLSRMFWSTVTLGIAAYAAFVYFSSPKRPSQRPVAVSKKGNGHA